MKGVIETCQLFGASIAEAIHIIAEKFGLSEKEASNYVRKFWKN